MFLYTLFSFIAGWALLIYNLIYYRKKKLLLSGVSNRAVKHFQSKQRKGVCRILSSQTFWVITEIVILSAVQILPAMVLNPIFGNLVNTGANYYGLMFIGSWLMVALCLLVKVDLLAQMDLITPAYPLALIFTKIGCFFAGCCRGVRWIYGVYNPTSRRIEFPAQLLEAFVALLLFVFFISFKSKFKKGTLFPVYLMIYSAIRFFTEFTRVEPAVFLGLKTYQILCIIGVAVGALEYVAARKYDAYTKRTKQTCTDPASGKRSVRR